MKEVKSLSGLAGPNASLKDAGGSGITVENVGLSEVRVYYGRSLSGNLRGFSVSGDYLFRVDTTGTIYRHSFTTGKGWNTEEMEIVSSQSATINATYDYYDIHVTEDGTKAFATEYTSRTFHSISMSTPWDLSTASLVTTAAWNTTTNRNNLWVSGDGTRLYAALFATKIEMYTMSTPFDLSTLSYVGEATLPTGGTAAGISFIEDGSVLYAGNGGTICEYTLSTPWDLSTTSLSYQFNMSDEAGMGPVNFSSGCFKVHPDGVCAIAGKTNTSLMVGFSFRKIIMGDEVFYSFDPERGTK